MTSRRARRARYRFRIYVAGDTVNSLQAVNNLNQLCREHLANIHEIEVVDVFKEPLRALDDGVLMTPTLVRLAPSPVLKIVGTLGQASVVREALGLGAPQQ